MRIEKILVPMDFSPTARLALHHAAVLARQCRARLTLLHVVEYSTMLASTFPDETAEIQRLHIEQAWRMLAALLRPEEWNDLDLRTIVKSGDTGDEIVSTARDEAVNFLVMGTHGRGLLGRSVIGSVTRKVLGRLEIPILTVHQLVRVPASGRILFATDLSESSREGLHFALELAQVTNRSLVALNAVDVGLEGGAEAAVYLGESRLEEARAKLDEFRAEESGQNFDVAAVLAETTLAGTIIRAAEEQSADLIAVAVTRNGGGSVANAIIRDAPVPVLSIPVRAIANQEWPAEEPAA